MCASYGLDPRAGDYASLARANDAEMVENLRAWAAQNNGETLRPTGRIMRNLNPLITPTGLELAWWGYLVKGEPAPWPSINTRSERLEERPSGANHRALVPATEWFEREKPTKTWYSFRTGEPFAMAAVTQRGTPTGGEAVTCYSIVMQPSRPDLAGIHDRMPLLIPESFFDEWLDPTRNGDPDLIAAARLASAEITAAVTTTPGAP